MQIPPESPCVYIYIYVCVCVWGGVLRSIFGRKREEVTVEWRKLLIEELNDMYSSPNIRVIKSRRIKLAAHVARMGERCIQGLVRKPGGKRTRGRLRLRWEDNIKMDLREMARGGMDWIDLAQDWDRWRALVNA